ncbi:MAG: hypothetical protein ACXWU5_05410, partial [Rhodoplanes sp.]
MVFYFSKRRVGKAKRAHELRRRGPGSAYYAAAGRESRQGMDDHHAADHDSLATMSSMLKKNS